MTRLVEPSCPGTTRTTPPALSAPTDVTRTTPRSPVAACSPVTAASLPNASWAVTRSAAACPGASEKRPSTRASPPPAAQRECRRRAGLGIQRRLPLDGAHLRLHFHWADPRAQRQVDVDTPVRVGDDPLRPEPPVGDGQRDVASHGGEAGRVAQLEQQ